MKIYQNPKKSKPQCNVVSIFLLAKFLPSTVASRGRPTNISSSVLLGTSFSSPTHWRSSRVCARPRKRNSNRKKEHVWKMTCGGAQGVHGYRDIRSHTPCMYRIIYANSYMLTSIPVALSSSSSRHKAAFFIYDCRVHKASLG